MTPPAPVSLEALLEGSSFEIPTNLSLNCKTSVASLRKHSCVVNRIEKLNLFDVQPTNTDIKRGIGSIKNLGHAGKFFLIYGKKLKQAVLIACNKLQNFPQNSSSHNYTKNVRAEEVVNCIEKSSKEGNGVSARVRNSDSEEITAALPTEITEFYDTSIRPFIETQTESPPTIGSPYTTISNMTAENPPRISGNALESSNSMNYWAIGGAVGAGVLIAGLSAFAGVWAYKRKTLNKRRIKRCQEMVVSSPPKSSESTGLIPQNQLV